MNARRLEIATVAVLGAVQLVPVERSNPPVTQEVPAPPEVRAVLERSCYDCHSNATRWPWYAFVAPVSWLVARDVHQARRHMNFSTWDAYDAEERADHLQEAWKQIEEGEMPLWFYLPLHPEARLSEADRDALHAWTQAGSRGASHRSHGHSHHHGDGHE